MWKVSAGALGRGGTVRVRGAALRPVRSSRNTQDRSPFDRLTAGRGKFMAGMTGR
jgi:hypothetical protein